jgi:hypothetical protein
MKFFKSKIFLVTIFCLLIIYLFLPTILDFAKWKAVANAGFGCVWQFGQTGVVVTPCFTTGEPPTCEGGPLCFQLDAAQCAFFADVKGVPAGGNGAEELLPEAGIVEAGLTSGGQVLGCMTSPVTTELGNVVFASAGGCYNCALMSERTVKMANFIEKYFIPDFLKKD